MVAPLSQERLNSYTSSPSKLGFSQSRTSARGEIFIEALTLLVWFVFTNCVILFAFVSSVFKQCLCGKYT